MKTKRFIALIMAVVMSVGVLSFGVAAESSPTDEQIMQYIWLVNPKHYELAKKQEKYMLWIEVLDNRIDSPKLTTEEWNDIIGDDFTMERTDSKDTRVEVRVLDTFGHVVYSESGPDYLIPHTKHCYTLMIGSGSDNMVFDAYKLFLLLKESDAVTVNSIYNDRDRYVKWDIPLPEYPMGDVNDDNYIDARDILLIRMYIANWDVEINFEKSDINNDGKVNAKDAGTIIKLAYMYLLRIS